jgi:hypothetical protein
MDMHNIFQKLMSICIYFMLAGGYLLLLSACGTGGSATLPNAPTTASFPTLELPTTLSPVPIIPPRPTSAPICTNNLSFIKDVTIPDNTIVDRGSLLDKQWLVQNSGECNWDVRYRLQLVSGDILGASPEQALFPARAGTQANLRILFTSPENTGVYFSEWRAFDGNGLPFGESFFIKIIVQ